MCLLLGLSSCSNKIASPKSELLNDHFDAGLVYKKYKPKSGDRKVSRADYFDKMYGFWLGECIANWTGLVTEMDKIGNICRKIQHRPNQNRVSQRRNGYL